LEKSRIQIPDFYFLTCFFALWPGTAREWSNLDPENSRIRISEFYFLTCFSAQWPGTAEAETATVEEEAAMQMDG
jgi:hypothetical protein